MIEKKGEAWGPEGGEGVNVRKRRTNRGKKDIITMGGKCIKLSQGKKTTPNEKRGCSEKFCQLEQKEIVFEGGKSAGDTQKIKLEYTNFDGGKGVTMKKKCAMKN